MRIAVIQRFLPGRSHGGVGHFTHGLCNALVQRGHSVSVFSQDPSPAGATYRVVTLPSPGGRIGRTMAPLGFPFQIAGVDFSGFDLIHAQGDDAWIPKGKNPPVVRTLHGSALAEAIHNGLRRLSLKRFLMHSYFYLCELIADLRAARVVADSESTRRYYPRVHAVIPNGVDLDRFCPNPEAKSRHPSILFVGQMRSRKRGDLLLKVVQQDLRPRLPSLELWLVCPEKVAAEGCHWLGPLDGADLVRLYQQAWVFCLPSSYEGFGRPYLEAMAAGTPVVATENPGASELLDRGRCGMLVPDASLAEALHTLLVRENLRAEYARKGLERAQRYSWSKVADQYERMYEAVLARQRGKTHAP